MFTERERKEGRGEDETNKLPNQLETDVGARTISVPCDDRTPEQPASVLPRLAILMLYSCPPALAVLRKNYPGLPWRGDPQRPLPRRNQLGTRKGRTYYTHARLY